MKRRIQFINMKMKRRFLLISLLLITAVLGTSIAASSMAWNRGPIPTFRIPDDQVPLDRVHTTGVEQAVQISDNSHPSSELTPSLPTIAQRVPDELVPENVNTIEMKQVITVPLNSSESGRESSFSTMGTITLIYGFHWYQFSPYAVAVAGYARTTSDFCTTKLYAEAKLYRNVSHQNNDWEFMERAESSQNWGCVMDSGEAKTGYWTAPNGTDWRVNTQHAAWWPGGSGSWSQVKYDSFP